MNTVDLAPLAGVANLAIAAFASVATVAIPFLATSAIQWLRAHTAHAVQQTQAVAATQIDPIVQRGFVYADKTGAPRIKGAADYLIAQAPNLLRTLGYDPATDAGKAAVTRMVTARTGSPAASPG